MGPSKVHKQSFIGAVEALQQSTNIAITPDTLKVEPNEAGAALWDWAQPSMGAGGHILGLKAPSATDVEVATKGSAFRQGSEVLAGLKSGVEYTGSIPNHALGLLLVLAENSGGTSAARDVVANMGDMWIHAIRPPIHYELEAIEAYETKVLSKAAIRGIAGTILKTMDCSEPSSIIGRRWVKAKLDELSLPPCSNKGCRFIARLVTSVWSRFQKQHRILTLVEEIKGPVRTTKRVNPVEEFVLRCWSMRPSSISCKLPKSPPECVKRLLEHTKEGSGRNRKCAETKAADLFDAIKGRFAAFEEWCTLTNKNTPEEWSDTLSGLARAVNPIIATYNSICTAGNYFAMASSYVPKDLAPEMYAYTDDRKLRCTGYFFYDKGMYYCYSSGWRKDAYRAVADGRYETNLISRDEATTAGSGQMPKVDADIVRHITYLQEYYLKGGFMKVNKHMLLEEWNDRDK